MALTQIYEVLSYRLGMCGTLQPFWNWKELGRLKTLDAFLEQPNRYARCTTMTIGE